MSVSQIGLVSMSISAGIMILFIAVVRAAAINHLPKVTFLLLWAAVLLRLLVPFSLSTPLSDYSIAPPSRVTVFLSEAGAVAEIVANSGDDAGAAVSPPASTSAGNTPSPAPRSLTPAATLSVVRLVWLAGAALCGLYFAVVYFKCRRRFGAAVPLHSGFLEEWLACHKLKRTISIRELSNISAPITYGVLRPVILLPRGAALSDTARLKYILEHEFVHIRRLDAVSKILLTAALCLHWANPLVWVMYTLANRDLELSCDERIVRSFGDGAKSDYALALIAMEERKSGLVPFASGFGKNAIEERIKAIMKLKKTSLAGVLAAFLLVSGATAVLATSAAGPSEANSPKAESGLQKAAPGIPTESELSAEYGGYGVSFSKNGKMLFKGEPVRYFWDGYEVDESSSSTRYEYFDEAGTVDIHTERAVIDNKDGSMNPFGALIGIIPYSSAEFDNRDFSKASSGPVTYSAEGGAEGGGRTFAEIFEVYEKYGITYNETTENGRIKRYLYFNGKPVRRFIDESPSGVFTFEGEGGETDAHAVYDENGKLSDIKSRSIGQEHSENYEEYAPFGLTYSKAEGRFFLNGESVRYFEDKTLERYFGAYEDGKYNVYAVRNPAGILIKLETLDAVSDRFDITIREYGELGLDLQGYKKSGRLELRGEPIGSFGDVAAGYAMSQNNPLDSTEYKAVRDDTDPGPTGHGRLVDIIPVVE